MSTPKVSLDPNPTFRKEIVIPGPGGQELKLDLEFRHRDVDELKEFIAGEKAVGRSDVQSILEAVANWHNCTEEFNEASVAKLVQKWHSAPGVIAASYVHEQTGARLGN
ncbi:Phage tail assembly chaperone [Roseateles sp. YR242]|uniref:phage tail assembly chaperone n=1 Tax=Roseateles sp. YR242 TaxID=1855305 RepID=UPI0008C596DD|nr:phage tail assembly chaperone [Roseateles sp. YR242]SEL12012.1 Phage tail assembly chaperone [Roseateles sp. YR242]